MRTGDGALTKTQAATAYRKLILARLAEEKIREEYFNDEMKTPVHLSVGQEAIPVGVCAALPPGFKTFGTYRNHALYLAVTDDTVGFFEEIYGRMGGPGKGKAGSMHLAAPDKGFIASSAIVGTTIPVAVGAALAESYRKSDSVVAVFFGEGAVDEGAFWESLNFAALRKLRVLFVCEDNGLAIHAHAKDRQGYDSMLRAVRAFRCHADEGDGCDLAEVFAKTRGIVGRMDEDPKPGFLRLTYLRSLEHVGVREDFDAGYRSKPPSRELKALDPVQRFEAYLLKRGRKRAELDEVRHAVQNEIDRSVESARKSRFPGPEELFTDVHA
ncbi:MAG: thiamine pyrophosphate-dependent dehydrogenase E1 component subunit alpha [Elusimicrobiota bacterium]